MLINQDWIAIGVNHNEPFIRTHASGASLSGVSIDSGCSFFWGVYAVFLVVLGIWKRKQYLRISGMVLFGLTLLKLFFYDIAHLNTLSKTIVFISLGALLLIISFLYNKFNKSIQDDTPA